MRFMERAAGNWVVGWYLGLVLTLLGCPGKVAAPELKPGESAVPGGTYDVRAALSAALGCAVSEIAWSVAEPACGSVVGGLYTAPACGSTCVPGTAHVRGTGCGKTAEVAVSVAEAVVSVQVCGVPAGGTCCARDLALPPGGAATFYATVGYSCPGHFEHTPSQPPAACP